MTDIPINPETGKPYERRKNDAVLNKKLDEAVEELNAKVTRFFVVIGVFLLLGTFVFGLVFYFQGKQGDDIQDQRFTSLVESCEGQNRRHDTTITRIRQKGGPLDQQELRIFLVDALQPRIDDCDKYAKQRVKE